MYVSSLAEGPIQKVFSIPFKFLSAYCDCAFEKLTVSHFGHCTFGQETFGLMKFGPKGTFGPK